MKLAQDIIIAPIITEKSMTAMAERKYTFKVAKNANKVEIAKAIEKVFPGTKVEKVHTMNVKGKLKRVGRFAGYRPDWKKAIVTLTANSGNIEFFESMQ